MICQLLQCLFVSGDLTKQECKSHSLNYKSLPVLVQQPVRHKTMESKATEIRGEEKSKGGVKYEVVLAPSTGSPPRARSPSSPKPLSVEDIEKKLKDAEERRKSIQCSKTEKIHVRLEERFAAVQEALQTKMDELSRQITDKQETSQMNREQYLEGIKEKVRQHVEHVETVRLQLQQQVEEARAEMEKDLARREENREKLIEDMRERMRAHEEHVQNVRKMNEQRVRDLERKIEERLEHATTLRSKHIEDELVKLREHTVHGDAVREKRRSSGSPVESME